MPKNTTTRFPRKKRRWRRIETLSFGQRICAIFSRILITAPITITFTSLIAHQFYRRHGDALIPANNPETYLPFGVPGIGLIAIFLALTFIGALTAGFVGRTVTKIYVLNRMPVVRNVIRP